MELKHLKSQKNVFHMSKAYGCELYSPILPNFILLCFDIYGLSSQFSGEFPDKSGEKLCAFVTFLESSVRAPDKVVFQRYFTILRAVIAWSISPMNIERFVNLPERRFYFCFWQFLHFEKFIFKKNTFTYTYIKKNLKKLLLLKNLTLR